MLGSDLYRKRVESLISYITERNLDLALLTSPANAFYFTGFEKAIATIITGDSKPVLIVPRHIYPTARRSIKYGEVIAFCSYETDFAPHEKVLVGELWESLKREFLRKVRKIGLDFSGLKLGDYLKIKAMKLEIEDISPRIREMRSIKSPEEINLIEKAVMVNRKAMERAINSLEEGISELEVLAEIYDVLTRSNAMYPSRVSFGENSGEPHAPPSMKKLRKGDLVLIDIGARLEGYCSDVTRTVIYGEAPRRSRDLFEYVKNVHRRVIDAIKPGIEVKSLDLLVRSIFKEQNMLQYFNHNLGHGIGIEIREYPEITPITKGVLKKGMVLAVEPGLYLPGFGGVRFEDMILVTDDGCKIFSEF